MDGVTIGRVAHYVLTESDASRINEDRSAGIRKGNPVRGGEHVVMIMVKVFPNEFGEGVPGVNGQCLLDGNDSLWVTSVKFSPDAESGTWHWVEKA